MTESLSAKVKVNGKTITVSEATFVQGLQRSILVAEASSNPLPKFYDGLSHDVVTYVHGLLYPSLVSCSNGKTPTEEEFLKLKDKEVNDWINAASRFNPDWFSLSGKQKDEKEKKD